MSAAGLELVLVVPRSRVMSEDSWHGLRAMSLAHLVRVIEEAGSHRQRHEMEADPRFKQVIPYLILRDGARWFLMRRTRAGGDARLHERFSIGVGGHLNPVDADLQRGLKREWREELEADFVPRFRYIGLLNDDRSDVGSVHLGVVFVADAGGRPVGVRETQKLSGSFVDAADVEEVRDRLETWSALVFDALCQDPAFSDGREPAR
jgi:predicted NUDIX family phosphoesterase